MDSEQTKIAGVCTAQLLLLLLVMLLTFLFVVNIMNQTFIKYFPEKCRLVLRMLESMQSNQFKKCLVYSISSMKAMNAQLQTLTLPSSEWFPVSIAP